jgi:hypothetical protein
MATNNVDLNAGTFFIKTVSAATTFIVTNVPASGTVAAIVLELTNGGAFSITWWSNVAWPSGTPPLLSVSGVDVIGFYTINAGANWRGLLLGKSLT